MEGTILQTLDDQGLLFFSKRSLVQALVMFTQLIWSTYLHETIAYTYSTASSSDTNCTKKVLKKDILKQKNYISSIFHALSFKFCKQDKISSPCDLKESCEESDCLQTMLAPTQLEYVIAQTKQG